MRDDIFRTESITFREVGSGLVAYFLRPTVGFTRAPYKFGIRGAHRALAGRTPKRGAGASAAHPFPVVRPMPCEFPCAPGQSASTRAC
jgi:hypothetical protein